MKLEKILGNLNSLEKLSFIKIIDNIIKELKKAHFIKDMVIHFHLKTQNMSEWNILGELEETFDEDFFKTITVMNMGGGIPASYANTNIKVFDNILKKIESVSFLSIYGDQYA